MYLNNSIFGGVGVGVGCSMGLLPPCDELYRDAPPIKGTFSPGGRRGYSLAWPIWGCATGQGIVF